MFTIDDNALRNRLLRETDNLTLEKVLSTCRAHELAASQISEMCKGGPTPSTSINQTGHAVNKLSKPQGYEDKPPGPAKHTHGKLVYVLLLEKFALHVTKEIIFKAPQYVQLEV